MSSQNRRTLIAVFIMLLIVFEMFAYVATTPRPRERFFQIYVLGANRKVADYYPNNDTNIRPAELVQWFVGVTDFMGNVQLVVIRVKLGNQTIPPPDDVNASPSPAPLVTEFSRFIQNNETWEFPFVWQIVNAVAVDGSARIIELRINDETFQLQSSARGGYNFRLIIELWTWDTESGALQFGWRTANEHRVAWLQVWFNATTSLH
jgi:hypothetical protein